MADLATFGAAFGGSAIGSAVVRLVLDASTYQKQLATAKTQTQAGLSQMGTAASRHSALGQAAFAALGFAAVTAAAHAVRAALDYEAAFGKIAAISNAGAENVEKWKEQVLDLAGETAQSPMELAEALYFLSSAGLDTSDVMAVLERSAKAAAVGLGSVVDIAKITANAVNAYAASGLTATEATDTLVAAVREGSAEPEEFAGALGRVLPIASKASIGFDEVAASLASVSNIGLDVNEGVTAMRGLMVSLYATTPQATEALAELGITTDELRRSMEEDGIISTLRMLEEATGGDIDKMRALVPNVRALTGAFGLTSQEAEKVDAIFRSVADSTGALNKAFATMEQNAAFQAEQMKAEWQAVSIEIGQELIPVFLALGRAVKASIPLVKFLAENLDVLIGVFLGFKALKVATMMWEVAASIRAVGGAITVANLASGASGGAGFLGSLATILKTPAGAPALLATLSAITVAWGVSRDAARRAEHAFVEGLSNIEVTAAGTGSAVATTASGMVVLAGTTEQATDIQNSYANMSARWIAAAQSYTGSLEGVTGALSDQEQQARDTRLAQLALVDSYFAILDSANELAEAQREVNRLQKRGKEDTHAYDLAVQRAILSQAAFEESIISYGIELTEAGQTQADMERAILKLGRSAGLTKDDIQDLIDKINAYNNTPLNDKSARIDFDIFRHYRSAKEMAAGGIIAAQAGLVARAQTVLVGEGSYPTPFGRGAEAVLPLNDETMDRLGAAIARHIGGGPNVVPVVWSDEFESRVLTSVRRDLMRRSPL